jgi:hypothetical protein
MNDLNLTDAEVFNTGIGIGGEGTGDVAPDWK